MMCPLIIINFNNQPEQPKIDLLIEDLCYECMSLILRFLD